MSTIFLRAKQICMKGTIYCLNVAIISLFKETDDECTSLTHFYRYSFILFLVNNTGHIVNVVKFETVHLNLVYCYEIFTFQKLQIEILTTNTSILLKFYDQYYKTSFLDLRY